MDPGANIREGKPVLPGGTIGVLGGGQLGRMLAMVARRTGYRVMVYSPESSPPAAAFANECVVAEYTDRAALERFARSVDVVTFEFENVPVEPLRWIEPLVAMRPGLKVFESVQNRANEKTFLSSAGIPLAPFRVITTKNQFLDALQEIPPPCVLKTSGGGYDGKGQFVLRETGHADAAWAKAGGAISTLEAFVSLKMEVSVLVARDLSGLISTFGPIENHHTHHILDWSVVPARTDETTARRCLEISRAVALQLDLVGLICIEFFVTNDGMVLVNEIAPRCHNSGHLTIEAAVTSQFGQQLRTVSGWSAGSFELMRPAAMANLIGDSWATGTPAWEKLARFDTVQLHLYDKLDARPGRKMGHLTATGKTADEALDRVISARAAICRKS
jgi:5-(carboxyamino)imidazole ribonucleotide synthase